jgi:histidine ammonia-lyase
MGTTAAMDFYKMQEDLANILSIAHLGAAQALDIKGLHLASPSLLQLYTKVREVSRPLLEDRRLDKDIVALKERLEQL